MYAIFLVFRIFCSSAELDSISSSVDIKNSLTTKPSEYVAKFPVLSVGLALLLSNVEKECHGAWHGTRTSFRLILFASAVFIGLFALEQALKSLQSGDSSYNWLVIFFPLTLIFITWVIFRLKRFVLIPFKGLQALYSDENLNTENEMDVDILEIVD